MAVVRVTGVIRPYCVRWPNQPPGHRGPAFKKGRQAWWYEGEEWPARYRDRRNRHTEKKQYKREGDEAFYCRVCGRLHNSSVVVPLKEGDAPMACTRCYFDKIWRKAIHRCPHLDKRTLPKAIKDKMMTLGVALYVLREIDKLKKNNRRMHWIDT